MTRPGSVVDPGENQLFKDPSEDQGLSGQVLTVRAPHVTSDSAKLKRAFAMTRDHPEVTLNHVTMIKNNEEVASREIGEHVQPSLLFSHINSAEMEFDYPPTPPVDGINVFGGLTALRMSYAKGRIEVGSSPPQTIQAGTPVELHGIRGQGVVSQHMVIPVQLNAGGANVDVQGSAYVTKNGVPLKVSQVWWRRFLPSESPFVFALLLVTALLTAATTQATVQRRT
jgi:hypothetical protein